MSAVSPSFLRRIAVLALAAGTLCAATACATRDTAPENSVTPSAPAEGSAATEANGSDGNTGTGSTPTPGATGSATPNPDADAPKSSEPITFTCGQLLSLDDVYTYSPNATMLTKPAKAATGTGATLSGMGGLHCQIQNNSSGSVVDATVGKFTPKEIEYLKNNAYDTSIAVNTYNPAADEGYFTMGSTIGEAQVFVGSYWLILSSEEFTEPGALEPLASAAATHLRGAK